MTALGNVSIGAALRGAAQRIERFDARLLLEHVCACAHATLLADADRVLCAPDLAHYESLVARRAAGEPLAYLLGSAVFYDCEFEVSPDVLIPRADTQVLVDLALEQAVKCAAPRIADLGTGSGIVAIMLARLCPAADVSAVDLSAAALAVARRNAERHAVKIRFLEGSWYAPLGTEQFDLIVSNPPYVVAGDPHLEQDGLPFEPYTALSDGRMGGDGADCIRALIDGAGAHLRPGGHLLIEHGYDQAVIVRELLCAAGFSDVGSWRDGAAIERVSGGSWI